MESKIVFASPKSTLTQANLAKTAALSTAPLLLSVLTDGRLVPLALLTAFIGLGFVSIRKSAAEGNRSTTENIVIASMLIFAAFVWGYFIAGPLFAIVPVLAAILSRKPARNSAQPTPQAAERVLVRH